ncbi:hypothetical protein Bbelb_103650 [Branchiostoma belcheri]|nr:hypothetical protein Bbelb_103650 [Branchiostoma belcheri]
MACRSVPATCIGGRRACGGVKDFCSVGKSPSASRDLLVEDADVPWMSAHAGSLQGATCRTSSHGRQNSMVLIIACQALCDPAFVQPSRQDNIICTGLGSTYTPGDIVWWEPPPWKRVCQAGVVSQNSGCRLQTPLQNRHRRREDLSWFESR